MSETATEMMTAGGESACSRVACGVDIVATDRIERLLDEFGESVVARLFTTEEVEYCQSRVAATQHFAARWAAKEAAMKALPPLGPSVAFSDIGVRHDRHGCPELRFADWIEEQLGDQMAVTLSLSHDRWSGTAMAQVIMVGPGKREADPE